MAQSTVTDPNLSAPSPARRPSTARNWLIIGITGLVVVAAAIAVGLWASSSSPSSSSTASAQVKANWQTFFKGSTPVATRVALVQDGTQLRAILVGESNSGFARGLSANVTKVHISSPTTATVTYTIVLGGVQLTSESGQAIKVGGTWLVSIQSFCGLLAAQHVTPPVCTAM